MKNKQSTKNPKRKMALRMQTRDERLIKGMYGSPYLSKAWEARSSAIKERVSKQGKPKIKRTSTWVSKRSLKKKDEKRKK